MLGVEGLIKSYGGDFALRIESLEAARGAVTVLLGPNGSGKSTLLRLIAGIEPADRGSVAMDGMALRAGSPPPAGWRKAVTMVGQNPFLFGGTVGSNVRYGLKLRGVPRPERERRLRAALAEVGLAGRERAESRTLSGGEAQLTAIARALVLMPRVLLLDEPTAHVDRDNAARVESVILSLKRKEGLAVLLATHNIEQAFRLSGRVISIIGGRIVGTSPENVFRGTVAGERGGLKLITLRGGLDIEADTDLMGQVHVAIDPAAIIVSRSRLDSSARNSFRGRLVSAAISGGRVRLTVDAGVEFAVLVTETSFREMGLHPGEQVYLTFKSTAVRVF